MKNLILLALTFTSLTSFAEVICTATVDGTRYAMKKNSEGALVAKVDGYVLGAFFMPAARETLSFDHQIYKNNDELLSRSTGSVLNMPRKSTSLEANDNQIKLSIHCSIFKNN